MLSAVGGHLSYCDPDLYPVAHGDQLAAAKARLPVIRRDQVVYLAILRDERIPANATLTSAQIIRINDDYKQIQAMDLRAAGPATYRFTVYVPTSPATATGNASVAGTVDAAGSVSVSARGPGRRLMCPICLASGVLIATPNGPIPVKDVRVGMAVWTTDLGGRRVMGVVLKTGHMLTPIGHEVVRLVLADGRVVLASPGHPTADGRRVGDLTPGDSFDGSVVASAVLLLYRGADTYDLLPSGPTGAYFAGGILLGSTLALPPAAGPSPVATDTRRA